jgi:hypothetical protein
MIGGHQGLPPELRRKLTQGQQAVTMVILEQIRKYGTCKICNAHIASLAGVKRTTVTATKAFLRSRGVISCQVRRSIGNRNLPTIIRCLCSSLLTWIAKGPKGGWFQKFVNNKSRDRFYVRAVTAESETQPTTGCIGHPRSAALCLDSG